MTTLKRLNTRLKNAVQSAKQLNQLDALGLEVNEQNLHAVDEAAQGALDVYYELQDVKRKMEADIGHRRESLDARITLEDKLRDAMTIVGEDGKTLAMMQASDLPNMAEFVRYVLVFGQPILQEVLEKLSDSNFAKFEDTLDMARRKRPD